MKKRPRAYYSGKFDKTNQGKTQSLWAREISWYRL